MAYNALATAVTGDLWTAANHNTYIKDNFAAGVPDIFTAAGDIPYASGANAAAVLAIGSPKEVLTVNAAGTSIEWGNKFSGCSVQRAAVQSISGGSDTKIVFDTQTFDTDGYWTTDNTDAITTPWAGVYECSGFVSFAASTDAGGVFERIKIAGTAVALSDGNSSTDTVINFCYTGVFAASADLFLQVFQNGVSAINATADYQVTFLGTT